MKATKAYTRDLAEAYDRRHFGGRSGQYILQRDVDALVSLIDPSPGVLVDIPSGTGVYVSALKKQGLTTIAADASWPMLEITGHRTLAPRVLCDIYHLPFKSQSLKTTTTIRLLSHFPKEQLPPMLKELSRVLKPQGRAIFDSFRWTPRRWPLLRHFIEQSYIYVIDDRAMQTIIEEAGLEIADIRCLYIFSPIWLRKLPLVLLRALVWVETLVPKPWRLRVFWAATPSERNV